jgi:hypothetical protein
MASGTHATVPAGQLLTRHSMCTRGFTSINVTVVLLVPVLRPLPTAQLPADLAQYRCMLKHKHA